MRILIVDDHSLFRAGFTLLLKERYPSAEVFEAESVAEGVQQALTRTPDAVLLSLDMNANQGYTALAALRQQVPAVPVVVISSDERVETVRRCLQMHAMSFVAKTARAHVLHLALEAALAGGVFVPATSVSRAFSCTDPLCAHRLTASAHCSTQGFAAMTPREKETLSWLLCGLPTKSIASKMGVEDITIRKYVSHLLARFNVHRRTELIAMMSEHARNPERENAFAADNTAKRFHAHHTTTSVA